MWFYAKDGQQVGPVSKDELVGLLRSGAVPGKALVWREGFTDWVAAETVGELGIGNPVATAAAPIVSPTNPYQPPAGMGTAYAPGSMPAQTNGLATASMILGILSPLCFGILTAIPAVICGHMALKQINQNPNMLGRGQAKAGLIIGYIVIGLTVLYLIFVGIAVATGNFE